MEKAFPVWKDVCCGILIDIVAGYRSENAGSRTVFLLMDQILGQSEGYTAVGSFFNPLPANGPYCTGIEKSYPACVIA